jgi:hypothetical protein
MNYEEAVNVILMHGIGRDDVPLEEALVKDGFLGCLRPFSGLREENFLQVLRAIIALKPHLAESKTWEHRLVAGLWGLTTTARLEGLDPDGLLQRNKLLSAEDTKRLLLWVRCIEMAVSKLLRDGDPADALAYYRGEEPASCEELPIRWNNVVVGWLCEPKVDMFHLYGRWRSAPERLSAQFLAAVSTGDEVTVTVGSGEPELIGTVELISGADIEISIRPNAR